MIKVAKRTLINNRRSKYTLPTNTKLYPAQWNWDSAFIALGYSNFNLNFIGENQFSVNVNGDNTLNQIIKFLSENNLEVVNMTNETNRLEELFLKLTNKN